MEDFTEEQWKRIDELTAECDATKAVWLEAHKDDPCERCGSRKGVKHFPTGILARLTPRCPACKRILEAETAAYWRGYEAAERLFRKRSLWSRLFG